MQSFLVRHKGKIALAIVVIAGAGYLWHLRSAVPAGGPGGRAGFGNRVQPVSVAAVVHGDVPIWVPAVGTVVPRNLVTVRTRVDGQLLSLHFREGEMVKAGQLLAEVDPRPFQVQLAQAEGQLARDSATLENAKADLARYRDLWAKDSIARQQLDTQEALVRQTQGTVEADRAQVDSAKLQLEYTRTTAPIGGRIGLRQVDPGNQIHAADANGIAVIAQQQPTTVVFSIPQDYLPALSRRVAGGDAVAVEAWDREQKVRLGVGRLLTTDNQIDTATGTIKMKAEFANQDNILFPNQFVNARLLLGVRKDAIVVPTAAVQQGAKGAYVYAVAKDDTVTSVVVTPGPVDGERMAVDGQLEAGGRVVTDGADKLRDGAKVEVITAEARNAALAAKPGNLHGKHRPPGAAGAPDGAQRPRGAPPAAN